MRILYLNVLIVFFAQIALGETIQDFVDQGTEAFNQRDYVSASYYFNRARNHEQWEDYAGKMNVFAKLAYMEESQGHFDDSARYYRDAIRFITETDEQNRQRLEQYYKTRYANTLDRSGYYDAAEKIYWELFDHADLPSKIQLIQFIVENYSYQDVSVQQMNHLYEQIAALDMNSLGWGLAELYRIQEDYSKSYEIYNRIWMKTLPQAVENYLSMAEVFETTGNLHNLVQNVKDRFYESHQFVLFYILLMEYQNQSNTALDELDTYLENRLPSNTTSNAGSLVGLVQNELLIEWVELTEINRGIEPAITKVQQILSANPMDLEWRHRLSNLFMKQRNQTRAVQLWVDWFESEHSNPYQQLSAVEQIYQIGAKEKALELFYSLEESIPPSLKHREAKSALELGLYGQAISSFNIASISANLSPSGITNMILNHADTLTDHEPMLSVFIQAASGNAYNQTPVWLRDALVESGVKFGLDSEINEMVNQDQSGIWKFYFANAAQKYGRTLWAQQLLESVPIDSELRQSANQRYIEIISGNPSIPSQRKAADLIQPSIEHLIGVTDTINLTNGQMETLFHYMEYRLNSFEPGKALAAIQTIESSTPFKSKQITSSDVDRLWYNRARSLAQLASFDPAMELLDTIETPPYRSHAAFLKARIWLALKDLEKADPILQSLVVDRSDWQLSNNALAYLVAMEPLMGEPMSEFFKLQSYFLQGRLEESFPILRSLAVDLYKTDTEEWARYQIGELKARMGDWEGAVDEWKRLLLEVNHPVYHALIRYQFTRLPKEISGLVQSDSHLQELVSEFPNTLFSDLARIESEERLKGLTP